MGQLAEPYPLEARRVRRGLVEVVGSVDLDTAPILRRALADALADLGRGQTLVVDLSAVDFIDAAGMGVLVGTANQARRGGGQLALCSPSPAVRRVLQVVQLDGVFLTV